MEVLALLAILEVILELRPEEERIAASISQPRVQHMDMYPGIVDPWKLWCTLAEGYVRNVKYINQKRAHTCQRPSTKGMNVTGVMTELTTNKAVHSRLQSCGQQFGKKSHQSGTHFPTRTVAASSGRGQHH